jgi:hypothetical protein
MAKPQYIVIISRPWMNETGHGWNHTTDGQRFDTRDAAIAHGFTLDVSDDFNIGTEDGKTWLGGDFTVVHLPSQLEIVEGAGCIHCCRRAGRLLADAAVDWSTLTADNSRDWSTGLGEDTKMALAVARAVEWGCDAELCESDEEADDRG